MMNENQQDKTEEVFNGPGDDMKTLAIMVMLLGIFVFGAAFFVRTTVSSYSSSALDPAEVYNIGALQIQMIWIYSGLTTILSGVLLYCASGVMNQVALLRRDLNKKR